MEENTKHIVFYDGSCGLCHRAMQWLLRLDNNKQLHFAPLFGTTYDSLGLAVKSDSIVFYSNGTTSDKAAAVKRILQLIQKMKGLQVLMTVSPLFIQNIVYDLVAKTRYSIFGRKDHCVLPDERTRQQLLD